MAHGNHECKIINSIAEDVPELRSKLQYILSKQELSSVWCPPWEESAWKKVDLQNFKIAFDEIDRVYYYWVDDFDYWPGDHDLYGRMNYKGRSLYFHLNVTTDIIPYLVSMFRMKVYLTFEAEVFLQAVCDNDIYRHDVWKLMTEDGLLVSEPTSLDSLASNEGLNQNVPSLGFLCHTVIFDNRKHLVNHLSLLPSSVTKVVQQFNKIRETQKHRKIFTDYESEFFVIPFTPESSSDS